MRELGAECALDADCGGGGICWRHPGRRSKRCIETRSRIDIEGGWCLALQQAEPNRCSLEFALVGLMEVRGEAPFFRLGAFRRR